MEAILCAAIHKPGELDLAGNPLIYCGHRHCNILWQGKHVSRDPDHQGFLTTKGRFVDRMMGLVIALEARQLEDKLATLRFPNLYSEDLY